MVGMRLGRLAGVMRGVQMMGMGEMGMMAGGLMIAVRRVLGGLAMMMSGALVVLGGMFVMLGGALGVSHGRLLVSARVLRTFSFSAIVRQMSDANPRGLAASRMKTQ
jgi:hypothetical protein